MNTMTGNIDTKKARQMAGFRLSEICMRLSDSERQESPDRDGSAP